MGLLVLDRRVLHVGLGAGATSGYFIAAGAGSVVMAVLTYLLIRRPGPLGGSRGSGSKEYVFIHVIAGLVGLVAGAGLIAGVIGTLAWHRQANLPGASISIPVVHGITGSYVALGDSYSSGEGLRPFLDGTADISGGGNAATVPGTLTPSCSCSILRRPACSSRRARGASSRTSTPPSTSI